jgi:hypothetical protein
MSDSDSSAKDGLLLSLLLGAQIRDEGDVTNTTK